VRIAAVCWGAATFFVCHDAISFQDANSRRLAILLWRRRRAKARHYENQIPRSRKPSSWKISLGSQRATRV